MKMIRQIELQNINLIQMELSHRKRIDIVHHFKHQQQQQQQQQYHRHHQKMELMEINQINLNQLKK